jgi:DNA invertase Pin-like site-specific DNA recombinase
MMRVAIYARYSTDLQRDASIEDQIRVCRARAEREGWPVVEAYTDHATSGATTLRPGYQALLAALRASTFDVVLAESLDRFSRDLEHIALFFKQCVFHKVRIHTLAEGDVSELHIGLKGTMGALYLKDLAEKTRRGLEGRVYAGRSTGAPAYGYTVVRKFREDGQLDRGLREIDPQQAVVVKRLCIVRRRGQSTEDRPDAQRRRHRWAAKWHLVQRHNPGAGRARRRVAAQRAIHRSACLAPTDQCEGSHERCQSSARQPTGSPSCH